MFQLAIDENRCSRSSLFKRGKSAKSIGARSGLYGCQCLVNNINADTRHVTDLAYRSPPVFTYGIANPLDVLFATPRAPGAWSVTDVFQSVSKLLVPAKHKTSYLNFILQKANTD